MKNLRAFLFIVICLGIGFGNVFAHNQFRPWNHRTNPALLVRNQRRWVDIGVAPIQLRFDNGILRMGDVFQEVWVIDLEEIANTMPDDGWFINLNADVGVFSTLHLFNLGLGIFVDAHHVSQAQIPQSLFDLLGNGIRREPGQDFVTQEGSGSVLLRSYVEAGIYGSWAVRQNVFAAKVGAYVPILYSDNVVFQYDFYAGNERNSNGNYLEFNAGLNGTILSSVNLDNPTDFDMGFKMDLGWLKQDDRGRAMYGAAINNIPLVPAQARFQIQANAVLSVTSEDGLAAFIEGEDGDEAFVISEPDLDEDITISELSEAIHVFPETSVSGFYRFVLPIVDLIPHATIVLGDAARVNAGLVVEGNLPILNWLSMGIGRQDYSWYTSAALRIPLRIIEINAAASFSSPDISTMFQWQGLSATIGLALGL